MEGAMMESNLSDRQSSCSDMSSSHTNSSCSNSGDSRTLRMDMENDLEVQYQPSRWSNISSDPNRVIERYLDSVEHGASTVRELYGNRMHTKTHGNLPTDKTLIISEAIWQSVASSGNIRLIISETDNTNNSLTDHPTNQSESRTEWVSQSETDTIDQSDRRAVTPGQSERRRDGELCVATVHGGYWIHGSYETEGLACAEPFVSRGATFAAIGYGLAPDVSLPTMIEQVGRGAESLLRDHTQRAGGVYMIGHSAGAYLLTMLLMKRWTNLVNENHPLRNLKGLILLSGIYDLVPILPTSNNDNLFLTTEEAISLSPLTLLSQHTLDEHIQENIQAFKDGGGKVLVACGDHDSPAFQSQSQEFTQILSRLGIKTQNITVPDCDHFDIYTNLRLNGTELPPSSKIILEFMNFPVSSC